MSIGREYTKTKNKLRYYRRLLVFIAISLCLVSFAMPVFMTQPSATFILNWGTPSDIGNTFGGIVAPFIAAIAAWVTFEAFWVQYESNHYQRLDILKERFENNFFNFINILTNKIDNTVMDNVGEGHQVFHYMIYEYKAMLYYIHSTNKYKDDPNRIYIEKTKAFDLFINGVSASSTSRLEEKNKDEKIIDLNNKFVNLQETYLKIFDKPIYLKDYKGKKIKMFDGHRLRLIPFYRNFFIALQYIYKNLNGSEFVDEIDFYTKTLLSQMSEHELALIYLIFNFGKVEGWDFILKDNEEYIKQFMNKKFPDYFTSKTMNCLKDGFMDFPIV